MLDYIFSPRQGYDWDVGSQDSTLRDHSPGDQPSDKVREAKVQTRARDQDQMSPPPMPPNLDQPGILITLFLVVVSRNVTSIGLGLG